MGSEDVILGYIAMDANRFEADGWEVQSLVREETGSNEYVALTPWAFTALRDDLLVTVEVTDNPGPFEQYLRYSVRSSGCSESERLTARSVVERFPAVPERSGGPSVDRIVALITRPEAPNARQFRTSVPLASGLGTGLSCFVAHGVLEEDDAESRRALISAIADSLERDGWTVQRESAGVNFPVLRFVALRSGEVMNGSAGRISGESQNGVTLTEFPSGCATITPPAGSFDIVEQFPVVGS